MDRRKPKIYRESFQLKIVRTLISLGVFSLVILALLGFLLLYWTPAAREMGLSGSGTGLLVNLAKVFIIVTVVLVVLVLWISFLISRNLFGPLKRLKRNMELLIQGKDADEIRFRKSDELEFHYISDPFNQLVDKVSKLRKETVDLEEEVSDFLEKKEKGMIKQKGYITFIKEIKDKLSSLKKYI
jgi:signal transduction histidine kinase